MPDTTPRITIIEDPVSDQYEVLFIRYPIARSLLADTALDRAAIADMFAERVAAEVRALITSWTPDVEEEPAI